MKKSIIALMGLFTLVACSEDVYQDANKMNANGSVENGSGGMQTNSIDPAIPYESPYDLSSGTCCSVHELVMINNTDLDLHFNPYAGLARFDGAYDDKHFGWGIPMNITEYPHIYVNTSEIISGEYFKLAKCNTYILPSGEDHTQYSSQFGLSNIFTLITPPANTSGQTGLLIEFGKMYGIDAQIIDPTTNMTVNDIELKFPFLPVGEKDPSNLSSDWIPMPSLHSPVTDDLWYHHKTLEICVGNGAYGNQTGGVLGFNNRKSEEIFSYNGNDYILKLYTTATQVAIVLENY